MAKHDSIDERLLKAGDKVIILQNPHDTRAEGVVGVVIAYRNGAGFLGCDLVDIHFKSPRDGRGSTKPFGLACLAAATPAALTRLAEHHERLAADIHAACKTQRIRTDDLGPR